jgi:hypothetical protein
MNNLFYGAGCTLFPSLGFLTRVSLPREGFNEAAIAQLQSFVISVYFVFSFYVFTMVEHLVNLVCFEHLVNLCAV